MPPARTSRRTVQRVVLVPAGPARRGDELVRRYRLARLTVEGREARAKSVDGFTAR